MNVGVAGAGAFGTALAISLSARGPVTLWARDPGAAQSMLENRENKRRLPGVKLPDSVHITGDPERLGQCDTILVSVPTQKLQDFVQSHQAVLKDRQLISCCKGVDLQTGRGPASILAELCQTPAVLTGPSFATDIATGLPTALTLACADASVAQALQKGLSTDTLRLYVTDDVTGAELGGALKNVIAIACGATMGAGFGESARAAIMTRGFAELRRFALALDARSDTLTGLSGFGDLVLTCTSDKSRNYRFGQALARQTSWTSDETVEGAATAQAVAKIAKDKNIDMPITQTVAAMIRNDLTVQDAMLALLNRPLKKE
ncbi:NAD(P)H-dependent glycerol-3-phosphate dehydrogenase [Pseudaestuariivita rosea]|uniref:NAD(P)H-dependent glycerol-3-phosphate dehydrogenase n=1 Tax=Pseudaestuariivita rosea TaxID=2763263 RepID=UPI001ABAF973|nr:NAD(P)H-dependent glycerol-3-phosphate dehydrogenase [Pseudaestuariivita rosea]